MKKTIAASLFLLIGITLNAQIILSSTTNDKTFDLKNAAILYDENEPKLIKIAAQLLQQDIRLVTNKEITIYPYKVKENIILIGTNESSFIQELLNNNQIKKESLTTQWDGFSIQLIKNAFNNQQDLLLIAGANKRGAAYGTLYLSEMLGVSPWYWWADVPVKKRDEAIVEINGIFQDAPLVKYRGIFINDEAPALSSWSREKFGGFNHLFYTKVFELILRNKGNFIWPAMWGSAFYDDDPQNQFAAEDWGIVVGTSHHEPLMRAHDEWRRYGKGAWNYQTNDSTLRSFWRSALYRSKNEKIITLGMRGDGDEPMSEETATELLEKIVSDQRKIIEEVTQQPASNSPQVWALYKEVQDYYDKGMQVPDDVTLLFCDDNWGNVRRLPKLTDPPRKGGYGMYYHFDYVGGPRNYKWINTNPLPRIWEQMNLTWEHGVKELWIVNVGDIKPMEVPISFFLHQAWNPTRVTIDSVRAYLDRWTKQQFGDNSSNVIPELIASYSKINGRRKPELLDHKSYSLTNYNEFARVMQEYNSLNEKASAIAQTLPKEYQSAYYQLVHHPIEASSNLHEMYYHVALNHYYFERGDARANSAAAKVLELYEKDSLITLKYHQLNNGKWNHMMSQTHIGYTYWQQPEKQVMPTVYLIENGALVEDSLIINSKEFLNKSTTNSSISTQYEEVEGVVSIDVTQYSRKKETEAIQWKKLPDLGRTGSSITSYPYTESIGEISKKTPYLEYDIYTSSKGKVQLHAYFSPTLNIYHSSTGLRYAVQIDNEKPQIVGINLEDYDNKTWEHWMVNNIIEKVTEHQIKKPGKHTVRYWLIDNSVILQNIVINMGGLKESLLGPPPTYKPTKP